MWRVLCLLVAFALVCLGAASCIPVDITITVTGPDLAAPGGSTPQGFVQGYVYTPTSDPAAGPDRPPIVSQTAQPPAGYEVPRTSVVVTMGTGTPIRPDRNGFFLFAGQAPNLPPVPIRVDFPAGGFASLLADVPVTPVDFAGWAVQQLDLQGNDQYRNNASSLTGVSGIVMNFDITSSTGGRGRIFASSRWDLNRTTVVSSQDAFVLTDYTLTAGQTRQMRDVRPQNSDRLAELIDPGSGNQMLVLYLVAEQTTDPTQVAAVSVTGMGFVLSAKIHAPL